MTPAYGFATERAAHLALLDNVEPMTAFIARLRPAWSPTPWHLLKICDLFERSRHEPVYAEISMPPRHGKRLASTTKLLTPRGWRTHGDLRVGDEVFAPDGSAVRVSTVFADGECDLRVRFDDGEELITHGEHLWSVLRRGAHAEDVVDTNAMMRSGVMQPDGGTKTRPRFSVRYTTPLVGREVALPHEPYLLGYWIGNGTTGLGRITMGAIDADHVTAELQRRGAAFGARHVHAGSRCIMQTVLGGPHFPVKRIPPEYLVASLAQRRALMAGLVDSDGNVNPRTGRVRYVTTLPDLARDVEHLVSTLGYRPSTTKQAPHTGFAQGRDVIGRLDTYSVQWTPHDGVPPGTLPRKAVAKVGVRRRRSIVSIERCAPVPGQCIQVDHPSHLYLVGERLVPTHNSVTMALGLAWRCIYDPACLNFYTTFGDRLTKQTSRLVRRLVREAGMPLDPAAQDVKDWRTLYGGGLRATTVGGEITGAGCNGGVIVGDDMIKGRKQAESKLARDDAWAYIKDDLMSRLETGASFLLNSTRWHHDDPQGRIRADGLGLKWERIVLPAVRDATGAGCDEDAPGAMALWPEAGYDLAWAKRTRARGEYGWWSLYQQQPIPREGGLFNRSWFEGVDGARIVEPNAVPQTGRVFRGWDLAASTGDRADFTAGVKLRLAGDGVLYVEHVTTLRGSPHEVYQHIKATAEADGKATGISIPIDPGAAGLSVRSTYAQMLHGFTTHFSHESHKKHLRAEPFAAQAQAGNVRVVRGPWLDAYLAEMESFPAGKHDDQVDASSRSYEALLTRGVYAETFSVPGVITGGAAAR